MGLLTRFSRGPAPSISARVREEGLTYLSAAALDDLHRTVQSLETHRVPGLFIEAGCALGGPLLSSRPRNDPSAGSTSTTSLA